MSLPFIAGAAILYGAMAEPQAADHGSLELQLNDKLRRRLVTAREARDSVRAAYDSDTEWVSVEDLADSENELAEAEVAISLTAEEEIAAREQHVIRMRQLETSIKALHDSGSKGGEAVKYQTMKRERESAEILLLKARLGRP
jgi:hypothetical protein